MAYISGTLHRPLSAAAAVAVAALSWDVPNPFASPNCLEPIATEQSQIATSSVLRRNALADVTRPIPHSVLHHVPVASTPALMSLYHYAGLAKSPKDQEFVPTIPSISSEEVGYRWHLPDLRAHEGVDKCECAAAKSQTVVVLLGWLGAKQKHLKRYVEWYTKRGFHVVTFTFPMADIISYKAGGKAEQNTEMLANHLAGWVDEESGKNLVFHTFSNTGWLTYGVLLEKFQKHDPSVMGKIKGCIVDSAPVAVPDPQVWASGFSAAFLKKQSVATKSSAVSGAVSGTGLMAAVDPGMAPKPAIVETALLVVLEKFFEVVLNLPGISRRLSDVLKLLSSEQPKCPQLYIYSSADRVIPATSVESFIKRQQRAGHEIRACDFINSPHVDHFRTHPSLYTSQLTAFLEECVLNCSSS